MSITYKDYNSSAKDHVVIDAFVGKVLFWKRATVQIMSDIWEDHVQVTYWDDENQRPRMISEPISKTIDATDDVVREYIKHRAELLWNKYYSAAIEVLEREAALITVGSQVVVIAGKIKPATPGPFPVFHLLHDRPYSMGTKVSMETKVGIALTDAKSPKVSPKDGKTYDSYDNVAWIWKRNLRVANSNNILAELRSRAEPELTNNITARIQREVGAEIAEIQKQRKDAA